MDLLDTVMEIINGTPSPPINVLPSSASVMEPNNLSQSTAVVSVNNTATGAATTANETAPATTQTNVERNLDLKLPILSSSSSDSELDEQTNPLAGTSNKAEGERAASPPPNCAICLGRCKNKCFTDSCKHQFCFKCLCEWSKVKPECPLCKQTFKSIIHNVKSKDQFEEYHVQPPTVQISHPPFEMDFQEMRIFGVVHPGHNRNHPWNESAHRPFFDFDFSSNSPYSSASTGGSLSTASGSSSNRSMANGLRNQYVYRGELLDLYRQEYPGAIANSGTLSQLWRRYVYDRKLYAMPVADITGRFRESSARFYRDNPSQIHRLMPWINRDIVCLLRETQHDVTTVLESINSALTIMNILSPAFRRRLQPYLGTKTAHFIHELNNFARSPYDMIGYDRAVQYSPQSNNEEIIIEFTSSDDSSDNEHIDVAGDGMATGSNHHNHHGATATTASSSSSSTRSRSTHSGASINAINLTIHNRLTSASGSGNRSAADIPDDGIWVIDLRGESDMNDTTISTAQATTNSSTYHESVGHNATNTEGDIMISGGSSQPLGSVAENIELTSGSSDECEFVLERKPPHLRTPEMVSLDSASDSDVVFVEESKPLNKTSFSSSEGELNDNLTEHKTQTNRHHNKIAALVEAKKRNQSANLVKSEQHTEVYNMGASTSAALRLSIQNRKDKSRRGEGASSSNRLRRDKYALRNNDKTSRAERPKRRGKRLDSESSHSSTSSSTTISSSSTSTTSSTNSSSCTSSDEEYVASTAQKRNRNELARKRRTIRKTKKRKASTNGNRRTNKRDSRKRKKYNDYSSDEDEDEDEDDNGHVGKNFALVMAINERQKRQNQKNSTKQTKDYQEEREEQVNDEDESDGENSWRLKAVNEPLRKQQQQQQQQKTKISHKNNERKRRRKTSTTTQTTETQQTTEEKDKRRNDRKRQKYSEEDHKQKEILETNNKPTKFYKSEEEDTSSDESDNINLIQLKTKLTGQDQNKETTTERNNPQETGLEKRETLNTQDCNTNATEATETIHETEIQSHTTVTTSSCSDFLSIPPNTTTTTVTTTSPTTSINDSFNHSPLTTLAIASEMATHNIMDTSWTLTQNDLLNFTDDDDSIQPNNSKHNEHETNNTNTYHNDPQQEQQQQQEAQDLPTTSRELQTYHSHSHHHDNDVDHEDDEETLMPSNISPLNHHESSNVFVDGTSMTSTTTTTDTILNEAAEQISSAAVNFYNPQQSFNTADFADENSTNSSSSDSSMSSTTTSISSSSNSSNSSNTQTSFTNYGGSGGGGHS